MTTTSYPLLKHVRYFLPCMFVTSNCLTVTLNLFLSGPSDKHTFQAETKQLLDIVAQSLYSEKEVRNFVSYCHTIL